MDASSDSRRPAPAALLSLALTFACAAEPAPRSPLVPAPGSPFAAGRAPGHLAPADLDGDGDLDLVVADSGGAGALVVLLGDGRGAFAAPRTVPVAAGPPPDLVAVGDVDGDGRSDAAVGAHDSNDIRVLKGDGGGGFAPLPGSPFPSGIPEPPHNHGLALADLDGDGDLDLLFGNQDHGSVAVLLGDGRGGFAAAPGSPFAAGPGPYPFAVGDLDGDGRPDLAVPNVGGDRVTLLRGDGRGGFAPFAGSPIATPHRPFHMALADLDGSGRLDLVVSHDDSDRLSIWLADGEGGLRAAPVAQIGSGTWTVAAADFDGDGAVDLAGGTRESRVRLLLGRGDGTFVSGPSLETGRGPWFVTAADVDGDGRADLLALGSEDGTVSVYLQR